MKTIQAIPLKLVLEREGYVMTLKIVEGPQNLLDRRVKVKFTSEQLNKIGEWNPNEDFSVLILEN